MDYRVNLAARMLANKRGSLIGAVLAVSIGILVIHVNFVIYFPEGLMGWLREKYPERFGEVIDEADRKAQVELK